MNEPAPNAFPDAVARCRTILRRLVILEIVLTFIVAIVSILQTPLLPPALQEFERQASERFGVREVILLCVVVPVLVLLVVTWVALFRGWRRGRLLYTILWLTGIPLMLLSGPVVYSELYSLVEMASSVLGGIILGFLYFSDIRHLYEATENA